MKCSDNKYDNNASKTQQNVLMIVQNYVRTLKLPKITKWNCLTCKSFVNYGKYSYEYCSKYSLPVEFAIWDKIIINCPIYKG